MDSPSIANAVAKATPNVAALLDRHARWCAQMCRNVPSPPRQMFRNVPPAGAPAVARAAETFPNVPGSSGVCHAAQSDGTNPPVSTPAPRPLTYRQLACTRLIVRGGGTLEIAAHLGVEHHTIARWKRNPAFQIELERLRAQLTAAAVTPGASSPPPPPPPPPPPAPPRHRPAPLRMTRAQVAQEDRECEAMIEQMLRAPRGR